MATNNPTFSLEDIFPVVARVITSHTSLDSDFVTHHQIVSKMLSDAVGAQLVAKAMTNSKWDTELQVASNMVAWFSQQITIGKSAWTPYFDRKRIDGNWAYRASIVAPTPLLQDLEVSSIEGNPLLFFHIRRERDPSLRSAKLHAVTSAGSQPACEACGTTTAKVFPGLEEEILEVHHRTPLSANVGSVTTKLEDLAVLCPNCHRAIHKMKPMMSVEGFRAQFGQAAKAS